MSSVSGPIATSPENTQPYSPFSNGVARTAGATSRKRKYDEHDPQDQLELGGPFTIETTSNGPPLRPLRLEPKLLTSRSCLPLSYLDLNGANNGIAGTQIFSARNASLEANLHGDAFDQPLLLATSGTTNETLFAIERVDTGLYALCRLSAWVNLKALEKLHELSQNRSAPSKQPRIQHINSGSPKWWRPLAVSPFHDVWNGQNNELGNARKPTVRLCLSVPKPPALPPPATDVQHSSDGNAPESFGEAAQAIEDGGDGLQPALPDPAEALATVRTQYQEALYLSRSSLAYFAKGPLSRARAAFLSASGSNDNTSTLIQYLRSSVLTLAVMDKKYKDSLPFVVNALPAGNISEDDAGTVIASLQRKGRNSKKDKIGKDGLYYGEEANIARWWLNRHDKNMESGRGKTGEDALNVLLLEQRTRETQLQIILILEILAIEASTPNLSNGFESLDVAVDGEADAHSTKKRRPRKPQNLNTLLDLSVDRLSIWQSMRVEECKDSEMNGYSSALQGLADGGTAHADLLKSFCVDVVLPFYGARLPDVTAMLRQKLGGPKAPSPKRPPLSKASSTSRLAGKPGAAIQRPPMKRPRRTLERVLTEERTSRSRAPSLSRSATDSALPGLKREVNDTSLLTIPLNRVALQKSQRYSQREVDLKAVSQAADAKLKKKANIERELQGAIAALKKPNPRMAVKELVEAAEKRAIGPNSRTSKNPVRNLFAQGVQVTATPKGNRRKDVFSGLPRLPLTTMSAAAEPDEIPPSSAFKVSSSVQRHSAVQVEHNEPRLPTRYLRPTIEQTPTRGPSRRSKSLLRTAQSDVPTSVFLTPSKPTRSLNPMIQPQRYSSYATQTHTAAFQEQAILDSDIQETPQKPQIVQSTAPLLDLSPPNVGTQLLGGEVLPNIPSSPPILEEASSKSLYETLGWDDYVDELS